MIFEDTRKQVCKPTLSGEARKYYRFRADRFYGGIATADCLGCNLDCAFCWSYKSRKEMRGKFYSVEEVAKKLMQIAHEHGFRQARISGNEPTLCRKHLLGVLTELEALDPRLRFILETNGVILGREEGFVKELRDYGNLHVRVSFKTGHPKNFPKVCGKPKSYFEDQIKAIENLNKHRVSFHPAIVSEYYDEYLSKRLAEISQDIPNHLEFEDLRIYPWIEERMKRRGLIK